LKNDCLPRTDTFLVCGGCGLCLGVENMKPAKCLKLQQYPTYPMHVALGAGLEKLIQILVKYILIIYVHRMACSWYNF